MLVPLDGLLRYAERIREGFLKVKEILFAHQNSVAKAVSIR